VRYAIVRRVWELPQGWPAIRGALWAMRRLARDGASDPAVRFWTLEAIARCPPRDRACELEAVVERFRRELRYVADPAGIDLVQHPLFTILAGGSDCDCLSTLLAAAGLSLGWPVRFVVGARPGVRVPTHVLPEVSIGGRWLPVEVSSRLLPIGHYPPRFIPSGKVTL